MLEVGLWCLFFPFIFFVPFQVFQVLYFEHLFLQLWKVQIFFSEERQEKPLGMIMV